MAEFAYTDTLRAETPGAYILAGEADHCRVATGAIAGALMTYSRRLARAGPASPHGSGRVGLMSVCERTIHKSGNASSCHPAEFDTLSRARAVLVNARRSGSFRSPLPG